MAVTDHTTIKEDLASAGLKLPPAKWGWILTYGILLLLVAVLVLCSPILTSVATGVLFGIALCIYGASALYSGLTAMAGNGRWAEIVLGVIGLIAGLYALFNPIAGSLSLVWAIGFWLLAAGIVELIFAFRAESDKGWRLAMGALDVVLGIILMTADPATALGFLAFMVAISFAMRGVFMIILALGLKKVRDKLHA